jgi:diguanylate cyclase (GGDEF)-like protein/PAS domain S-box-containing protein
VSEQTPSGVAADPAFFAAVVAGANELVTVFERDGTIVFVNDMSRDVLGLPPDQVVGRRVIDFVHPDELPRAIQTLRIAGAFGTSTGTTNFRLRYADGSYKLLEMTSATVNVRGRSLLMTISRHAEARFALASALQLLLEDRPVRDIIANVIDLFTWKGVGSQVAIAWQGPDGTWQWLGSEGCAAELAGGNMPPGSVWAEVMRTGLGAVVEDPSTMPEEMRAIAARNNRGGYWIKAVTDGDRPVVISVWTAKNGFPPQLHSEGMTTALQFMRLIVRWADQHDRIHRAARFDELTGLPNRRSFFDALETTPHGAILYCDLDRFKPVNDHYGHAAGDEVLRQVARRLRDAVRAGDTVARIGGDEFAIICPASTAADARLLESRIRAAVERPIDAGPATVQVGISIGIAHTTDRLDAAAVAQADRDLYAAKAARRNPGRG